MALRHSDSSRQPFHREAGNVFFALFGTIVLLGALGATVSNFIKGPLTSSVQVTRANAAETQMAVITQVITMEAAATGTCDADVENEPIQWRDPSASEPIPTGGGLVPLTLGVASTKDPWGSEFGYCVWDHGASLCGAGRRLAGTAANPDTHTVIAIISPGPDKRFTTTCRSFAAADVSADGDLNDPTDFPLVAKANATDDDIIYTYSYEEATTASGGLWSLKSGSNDTIATIDKNIEVGGSGIFSIGSGGQFGSLNTDSISARTGDFINMLQGLKIPNAATFPMSCNDSINGVLRRSASGLEVCLDDSWRAATGGGASSGGEGPGNLEEGTADDCDAAGTGDIRYNPSALVVEYCNGTSWQSLLARSSGAALSIVPSSATNITITGPCVTTNCPFAFGSPVHFVVTNLATTPTGVLTVSATSLDGGAATLDSTQAGGCQGATLPAGGTCVIRIVPAASGNGTFNGVMSVLDGATPRLSVPLRGVASGLTCAIGAYGFGGIVASCLNSSTPEYVISPAGCDGQTIEPSCNGNPVDDPEWSNSSGTYSEPKISNRTSGAQNAANVLGYGFVSPAQNYCNSLTKGGYDDWYLPSLWEIMTIVLPNIEDLLIDDTERYWTSTIAGTYNASAIQAYHFGGGYSEPRDQEDMLKVRCMRRQGQGAATAEMDMDADILIPRYFAPRAQSDVMIPKYTVSASQQVFLEDFLVTSVNTPTPISVTGPDSPTLRINGAAPAATGTVRSGDIVSVIATGPAAPGTESVFRILVGSKSLIWRVAYPAANTRRIFVTSTTYNGNMGLTGADTNCQTRATAAGLTGNWYALISYQQIALHNRVPWNWNRVENMVGEVIASDVTDLFDMTTDGVAHYSETGARLGNGNPWVGGQLYDLHSQYANLDNNCQNWTSSAAGSSGVTGMPSGTTRSLFIHSQFGCNATKNLYCMGPF